MYYILVYLSSYKTDDLIKVFAKYTDFRFIIMSSETNTILSLEPNIKIRPTNSEDFMRLLRSCSGVITGGGFETVAEALYLNKSVLTIPIKGQYEQECNATAASKFPNGYKGTLAPVYLNWFLNRTKDPINEYDFEISTDEEVLQVIEHVLYDQV